MTADAYDFDVALSFAGEDRPQAEHLAHLLRDSGVRVFYDEFAKATLWGKDLYQHLQDIYKNKAQYCVVLVSENYIRKNWTKHELKQAQDRSFASDREYILPLILDGATLPGVPSTVGYLDLRTTKLAQVAVLLCEKLNIPTGHLADELDQAKWEGDFVIYNGGEMTSYWPRRIERAQYQSSYLVTAPFERIRFGDEKRWKRNLPAEAVRCHDCGVVRGQFHVPGCDMEDCPACGGQNIACGCHHEAVTDEQLSAWEEGEVT